MLDLSKRSFLKVLGTSAIITITPNIVLSAAEINPRDQAFILLDDLHKTQIMLSGQGVIPHKTELYLDKTHLFFEYIMDTFPAIPYQENNSEVQYRLNEINMLFHDPERFEAELGKYKCTNEAFCILVVWHGIKNLKLGMYTNGNYWKKFADTYSHYVMAKK